jgi:hypothetical protein
MPDPRKRGPRMRYTGATPKKGWAGSEPGDYGTVADPRVGGKAQAASSPGIKSASRGQMKTASRLRRKMGTGSMAHKAARRSRRKLY